MLDKIPDAEQMSALVGQALYDIWNKLCTLIDEKYDMECCLLYTSYIFVYFKYPTVPNQFKVCIFFLT